MIKQLISISTIKKFHSFFSGRTNTMLGRWDHRVNKNQKEIKFVLANSDHCGDKICGNPIVVKDILNQKYK